MKRLSFIVVLLCATIFAWAQAPANGPDFEKLQKKIQKSDEEIQHPKKSLKEKTWMKRGDLMCDLYNEYLMNSYPGIDSKTFSMLSGLSKGQRQEQLKSQTYLVISKERVDFYFLNDKLAFYKILDPVLEDPLLQASEAFMKAMQLDEKGKKAKALREHFLQLRAYLLNEGVNYYSQHEFAHAIKDFEKALEIGQLELLNEKDTILHYYLGIAYFQNKQFDKSMESFGNAIASGYYLDGTSYCSYYEACQAAGMPEKGKEMLLVGIEKFPEQQCLVMDLINFYISQQEPPEKVLPYVNKALEKDPENPVLYFVKGVVFDQLKRPDDALAAYEVAVQKNPQFVDAYYNMSALHYNAGVALLNEAVELPTKETEKYDQKMAEANEMFRKSIAPAEKVLTIDENHKESLDLLKSVYFRFRAEGDYQAKYDRVAAKLKELGA